MKHPLLGAELVAFILATGIQADAAGYIENWNTNNHNWNYWNNTNISMSWLASGGEDGGYVRTPLASLQLWGNGYWPGYLVDDGSAQTREPLQNIFLTTDTEICINLNALGSADLAGGSVHFFIGYWSNSQNYAFFYNTNALVINPDGWAQASVFRLGGDSSWTTVYRQGLTDRATDYYNNPQQFGFGLFDATGQPAGFLGMDNFAVVIPEPCLLSLLGMGLGGAWVFRRIKRRTTWHPRTFCDHDC